MAEVRVTQEALEIVVSSTAQIALTQTAIEVVSSEAPGSITPFPDGTPNIPILLSQDVWTVLD